MADQYFAPSPQSSRAVPPHAVPPSDVFIRTMESDLRSIRESGGGRPRPEHVVIPVSDVPSPSFRRKLLKSFDLLWFAGIGVAVIGVGVAVVYFFSHSSPIPLSSFLPSFSAVSSSPSGAVSSGGGVSASGTSTAGEVAAFPTVPPGARSLFRKRADQTLYFTMGGPVTSAADLQTPSQKISSLLSTVATSTFVEIVPQDASGARIAAPVFLSFIDGLVLDSGMIASHFRPDFTYFMYRAKGIWWPGYVLPLKAGENWLFLKDDVAAVESSPKISNLFLSSPGAAIVGGFHDGTVGDQPVRKLTFTDGTTAFLYGWYHGYLILCTSEAGMREALGRLY